jgi:hypothetical protein
VKVGVPPWWNRWLATTDEGGKAEKRMPSATQLTATAGGVFLTLTLSGMSAHRPLLM